MVWLASEAGAANGPLLEVSCNVSAVGFTSSAATVYEDGGSVALTVARIGDTGAASVAWATGNLSAIAGIASFSFPSRRILSSRTTRHSG